MRVESKSSRNWRSKGVGIGSREHVVGFDLRMIVFSSDSVMGSNMQKLEVEEGETGLLCIVGGLVKFSSDVLHFIKKILIENYR